MNVEKLDGHLSEPHSVCNVQHGISTPDEVLKDVTSNLPTSNHRGQLSSIFTPPSSSSDPSQSHSHGIKTEHREDLFALRNAHVSLEPKAAELPQTSIPRKISESGIGEEEDEHTANIQTLQDIVAQLANLDKQRAHHENLEKLYTQRIEKGERSHGELLQRLSQIQHAVEMTREQIRTDKEMQQKCRQSQRQAIARAETLHTSLSLLAAGSNVGSSALSSNR